MYLNYNIFTFKIRLQTYDFFLIYQNVNFNNVRRSNYVSEL